MRFLFLITISTTALCFSYGADADEARYLPPGEFVAISCSTSLSSTYLSCDDPFFDELKKRLNGRSIAGSRGRSYEYLYMNCEIHDDHVSVVDVDGNCKKVDYIKRSNGAWQIPKNIRTVSYNTASKQQFFFTTWTTDNRFLLDKQRIMDYAALPWTQPFYIIGGFSSVLAVSIFLIVFGSIGFLYVVGHRLSDTDNNSSVDLGFLVFLLLVGVLVTLVLSWYGGKIALTVDNMEAGVSYSNKILERNEFTPGAFLPMEKFPLVSIDESKPSGYWFASFVSGLVVLVLHILAIPAAFLLYKNKLFLVIGYYHVFVPSKHHGVHSDDVDEPLGGWIKNTFDIPSVKDILAGVTHFSHSQINAVASRNQARKNMEMKNQIDAQTDEIESEVALSKSALTREKARLEKKEGK